MTAPIRISLCPVLIRHFLVKKSCSLVRYVDSLLIAENVYLDLRKGARVQYVVKICTVRVVVANEPL